MSFTLTAFARTRPYLFHLTAQGNLKGLLHTKTLLPAAVLLSVNGRLLPRLSPRGQHVRVDHDGRTVWIRDQLPLHAGSIVFEEGWDMVRWLGHVDAHVFFWPGTADGPIEGGRNHFAHYAAEQPALLRVGTSDVLDANLSIEPLFCRFNSGAPRTANGRKSPRGSQTHVRSDGFEGSASAVRELVFAGPVRLPRSIQVAKDYSGHWTPLFA